MVEPLSSGPDPADLDGLQGPPTFVQIRPPAPPVTAARRIGVGVVGLAIVAGLAGTAYRLTVAPVAVTETEAVAMAAPRETPPPPPPQPEPRDLYPELSVLATDTAVAAPAWSNPSLLDRISPFDPSAGLREAHAGALQAGAPAAEPASTSSYEVSVRLGKGDTIGSALQKRGFPAEVVAEAVAALAPHVSLKRLPVGLVMTLQVRPAEEEAAGPILQALTLQPDARREITVARDGEGNYALERR